MRPPFFECRSGWRAHQRVDCRPRADPPTTRHRIFRGRARRGHAERSGGLTIIRTGDSSLGGPRRVQGEQSVRGHDVGIALHEAVVAVDPTAVFGFLPQGGDQFGPPVVLNARTIGEGRLAEQGHRLAECHVVVVQPALALAGILVHGVVILDINNRRLDVRVVLGEARVDMLFKPE